MSSDAYVARLTGVTKSFMLRESRERNRRLHLRPAAVRRFVAVDDVSLDVAHGEVVGVVGANGAGKSTLLKILSRVMHPDRGRVTLNGPIMSLLEVGAGFHPELTARENIYLNGAILGLDGRAIERSFDDIVSLAGVSTFLETPVKRFSSGMRVRLAIAVGLHLDCDAIVLDEVLSVGDAAFQRRCLDVLDRMVTHEGRGALLVSHNMQTIREACTRVVVLAAGRVVFDGSPEAAIDSYFRHVGGAVGVTVPSLNARTNPHGTNRLHFQRLELADLDGRPLVPVTEGPLGFEIELDTAGLTGRLGISLHVSTKGTRLASIDLTSDVQPGAPTPLLLRWHTPLTPLASGQYTVSVSLTDEAGAVLDATDDVLAFTVTDPARPLGSLSAGLSAGHVVLGGEWTTVHASAPTITTRSEP